MIGAAKQHIISAKGLWRTTLKISLEGSLVDCWSSNTNNCKVAWRLRSERLGLKEKALRS